MFSVYQGIPSVCSFWINYLFDLDFVFRLYGAHLNKRGGGQQKGDLLGKGQKVKLSHQLWDVGLDLSWHLHQKPRPPCLLPLGLELCLFLIFSSTFSLSSKLFWPLKSFLHKAEEPFRSLSAYQIESKLYFSIKTLLRCHLPRVCFHLPLLHCHHHS